MLWLIGIMSLLYWLFSEPHLYCLLLLETSYEAPVNHFYVAENPKTMQFQKFVVLFKKKNRDMKTRSM